MFSPLVPESSRLRSDNAGPATNELWTPLLAGGFGFGSGFRSRSRRPLEDAVDGSLPIRMGLASPSMTAGCLSSTYPRHFRQPSKSINACMQPHSVTFCCNHSNRTGWINVSIFANDPPPPSDKPSAQRQKQITYLGQEIIAARRQRLVTITLQTARRQSHDDDGTLEEGEVMEIVLLLERQVGSPVQLLRGLGGRTGRAGASRRRLGKHSDAVQTFESADLLGSIQPVHHGQLDVHQDEMEPSLAPFSHRLFSVSGTLPPHAESLHEGFQQPLVDDVVLHDQHVDGRNGALDQPAKRAARGLPVTTLLCLRGGPRAGRGSTGRRGHGLGLRRLHRRRRTRWDRDRRRGLGRDGTGWGVYRRSGVSLEGRNKKGGSGEETFRTGGLAENSRRVRRMPRERRSTAVPVAAAARGWQRRRHPGGENGDRGGRVGIDGAGGRGRRGGRGGDVGVGRHDGKILAMVPRLVVIVNWVARGGFGGVALEDVDDEGLLDHLAAGVVVVQDGGERLLGAQDTLGGDAIARIDADDDVGRIKGLAQRIGIFEDDLVPQLVDDGVRGEGDQGGRAPGALDPDLAGHCRLRRRDGLETGILGTVGVEGDAGAQQVCDQLRVGQRQERLATYTETGAGRTRGDGGDARVGESGERRRCGCLLRRGPLLGRRTDRCRWFPMRAGRRIDGGGRRRRRGWGDGDRRGRQTFSRERLRASRRIVLREGIVKGFVEGGGASVVAETAGIGGGG